MNLDLKNRKLLYYLDFHARLPLSQIAKQVGVSKQSAKYRLELLEKKGIIQGYYADINASKLGLNIYLVYLKFSKMSSPVEKKFFQKLSSQKTVGVNVSLQGKWDYCIGVWAETIIHFKNYYEEIIRDYAVYVKSKTIMIETDFFYFKPKQILNKETEELIVMNGSMQSFDLDDIDKKILTELSLNARISLVYLGEKTNLTPNGVKERIKKLEKEKIILGYRVMIDYNKLGFLHYRIFFHLTTDTKNRTKQLIQYLKQHKTVVSVTKTIGYCELECRAIMSNLEEYYSLLEKLKTNFPDLIAETESILYYKFHKSLNYYPFSLK